MAGSSSPRSILITGAASGIGRQAAEMLHARGWQVFAAVRKADDVDQLSALGMTGLHLDYTLEETISAAVDQVLAATDGRLDALFNNGTYGQVGALEDIATEHVRAQFESGFFGWHELTRRVLPIMRAQGHGRIVNCSSVLGIIAMPYRGPYTAMKYALEGYTDTLRMEVEPFGIKVVSIQPGPITSRFRETALATFERTVTLEGSAYEGDYQVQLKRLRSRDKATFELGPEAVTEVLIKALESPRPKPIYRVTRPAKAMAIARRLLPTGMLHRMLAKSGQ
ncbi:MAG: SDR family NAD(P)-dependent oxidoreductase [Pseudomonadota bacterium]